MREVVKENGSKKVLAEAGLYFGAFLLTFVLFMTLKPLVRTEGTRMGVASQAVIAVLIAGVFLFGGYLALGKKLTAKRVIVLMLAVGYLLRAGYMLYTSAATRQYDTYSKNFDGHEAYAWTLFSTGKLPTTNNYQFYHPPLNAMVQAAFMHFISAFTALFKGDYFPNAFLNSMPSYITAERFFLYSSCQILSVTYSFITCVIALKILALFDFDKKWQLVLSAFLIFFPRTIQFSGMLNNDALAFLFATVAIYYALKWQKQGKRLKDILFCALAVGLGMMTKISMATVCLPIAFLFMFAFIDSTLKLKGTMPLPKLIVQYALFLLICAPIGLWFQVYAKVRFDQPFGFVFSNLNHKLYTGDHSFFERFILCFDLKEYFGSLWCIPFEGNYYLFNYALKSAVFGEFAYWQGEGFGVTAVVLAYALSACLFVALSYCAAVLIKRRKNPEFRTGLNGAFTDKKMLFFAFMLLQSQVLSEIYFYIKMPYGCTMDFRYIMPMILAIALTLGYTQKTLVLVGGKTATALERLLLLLSIGFLIASSLFYCVCI